MPPWQTGNPRTMANRLMARRPGPVSAVAQMHSLGNIPSVVVIDYDLGNNGPPYSAASPSSSSIRSSWLYFAIRSVREAEPVLI